LKWLEQDEIQAQEERTTLQALFAVPVDVATSRQSLVLKRLFDLLVTLFLVLIFTPFALLIALLIKLSSPGPVLYVQRRVGKYEEVFDMYKFRTMVQNADEMLAELKDQNEAQGPFFKIKDDPRKTRVGKWLRKFSLDELPQLINVLRGDMSLVGPRPMPVNEVEGYNNLHRRRHEVIPGMTGLWQVNGRSDLSFDEMIELDILYIQNQSPRLDFSILLKTIPVVFLSNGAY